MTTTGVSSASHQRSAFFLLALISTIWGTSFILIKQGLKAFSPEELACLRVIFAFLFLSPLSFNYSKQIHQSDYWKFLLSGMMAIFIPAILFSIAQTSLNSSLAGILNALTPTWTVLLGILFFHQKFRGWSILGLLISLSGALMLVMAGAKEELGEFNSYGLLIILATSFYGLNLNFIKFKLQEYSPITIISVSLLFIVPLAIGYLFLFTPFIKTLSSNTGAWSALFYIALLGLMSTSVASLLFYKLLKISSPIFASSVTYIMPIVSIIWGVLDGEQLFFGHLVGMTIILVGIYLTNKK